jgi:hypothetical protein
LARRTSYDDIDPAFDLTKSKFRDDILWFFQDDISGSGVKRPLGGGSALEEIHCVRLRGQGVTLDGSNNFETCRLETQGKAPTPREQIKNTRHCATPQSRDFG